ncbi:MAG: M48 family metallopeptidase [Vicinamibacterales bacterium]
MPETTRVSQWDSRPPWWMTAAGVGLVLALVAAYRYGTPLAAGFVADHVPPAIVETLSEGTLQALDSQVLGPSTLPASRQSELVAAFDRIRLPGRAAGQVYRIVFRGSAELGANAMALPSGTIVVTDGLVTLAGDDREILAVLAHEAGHVDHRHGLRSIVQGSIVSLLFAWVAGDSRSLVAKAPAALLQAKYSRDLEREADDYAADALRANNISVRYLASFLERLDAASATSPGAGAALPYLSTHPATKERLDRLRSQQ